MMKRVLAIVIVAVSGTGAGAEQSCRQSADSGKAICVGGVLYRCACRQVSGSTLCSWDNAASACSALSSSEIGSQGVVRESRRAP